MPGTELIVRGLKMEPDTALAGHSGSQSSPQAHNIENIRCELSAESLLPWESVPQLFSHDGGAYVCVLSYSTVYDSL